jgi:hypothetical protein
MSSTPRTGKTGRINPKMVNRYRLVNLIKLALLFLLAWNPDNTGSKTGKPLTRYTCLACPRSCVLYVKGGIVRIRQLCLQFKKMDGYSLWTRQDKP